MTPITIRLEELKKVLNFSGSSSAMRVRAEASGRVEAGSFTATRRGKCTLGFSDFMTRRPGW